jgi:hypothetical protein
VDIASLNDVDIASLNEVSMLFIFGMSASGQLAPDAYDASAASLPPRRARARRMRAKMH